MIAALIAGVLAMSPPTVAPAPAAVAKPATVLQAAHRAHLRLLNADASHVFQVPERLTQRLADALLIRQWLCSQPRSPMTVDAGCDSTYQVALLETLGRVEPTPPPDESGPIDVDDNTFARLPLGHWSVVKSAMAGATLQVTLQQQVLMSPDPPWTQQAELRWVLDDGRAALDGLRFVRIPAGSSPSSSASSSSPAAGDTRLDDLCDASASVPVDGVSLMRPWWALDDVGMAVNVAPARHRREVLATLVDGRPCPRLAQRWTSTGTHHAATLLTPFPPGVGGPALSGSLLTSIMAGQRVIGGAFEFDEVRHTARFEKAVALQQRLCFLPDARTNGGSAAKLVFTPVCHSASIEGTSLGLSPFFDGDERSMSMWSIIGVKPARPVPPFSSAAFRSTDRDNPVVVVLASDVGFGMALRAEQWWVRRPSGWHLDRMMGLSLGSRQAPLLDAPVADESLVALCLNPPSTSVATATSAFSEDQRRDPGHPAFALQHPPAGFSSREVMEGLVFLQGLSSCPWLAAPWAPSSSSP